MRAVVLIDSIGTPFYSPLNHESPQLACKNLLTIFFRSFVRLSNDMFFFQYLWSFSGIIFLSLSFQTVVVFLSLSYLHHANLMNETCSRFFVYWKKSMSTHIIPAMIQHQGKPKPNCCKRKYLLFALRKAIFISKQLNAFWARAISLPLSLSVSISLELLLLIQLKLHLALKKSNYNYSLKVLSRSLCVA